MHAKKLLSLLLSALAAVTLLASCGSRWDYSREAVKAANEARRSPEPLYDGATGRTPRSAQAQQ